MKVGDKVQVEGDKQGDYWLVELGRADNGAGIETATVEDETGWKWTMDRSDVTLLSYDGSSASIAMDREDVKPI